MMYMKEKNFELDEGEEKIVDESSSTSFKGL